MNATDEKIYSVTELTRELKRLIEERYRRIWVEGEISNFKHHSSGHMYFTLKDEKASLRCVMFRNQNRRLQFRPENGMRVRGFGDISIYEVAGSYQLYVYELLQTGMGALYEAFERLKKKLEEEGLFDKKHKKPIPAFPSRIGIVTSPTGAAIRDMIHVIHRRCPGVDLHLYPVRVQGENAAGEIAEAIRRFNRREPKMDVLITGRGGGSIEDLWAFNEEVTARAVFESEIPIISAVGHEIDFTITDFTADVRAATPSAAGEMVVPDIREMLQMTLSLRDRIHNRIFNMLENRRRRLEIFKKSDLFRPERRIREYRQSIDAWRTRLAMTVDSLIRKRRNALTIFSHSMKSRPESFLKTRRSEFRHLLFRLRAFKLEKFKNMLELKKTRLMSFDPREILKRGYSICRKKSDGKIVRSWKDVKTKQKLSVTLHEGGLDCSVDERKFL